MQAMIAFLAVTSAFVWPCFWQHPLSMTHHGFTLNGMNVGRSLVSTFVPGLTGAGSILAGLKTAKVWAERPLGCVQTCWRVLSEPKVKISLCKHLTKLKEACIERRVSLENKLCIFFLFPD